MNCCPPQVVNTDFVWDVVKNDLPQLRDAIDYFIEHLYEIVPVDNNNC